MRKRKPDQDSPDNNFGPLGHREDQQPPLPDSGDFTLEPPEEPGDLQQPTRPKRTYKPRKPKAPAVVQAVIVDEPPDPSLVATCLFGTEAVTELAQNGLGFSDPGEKWRLTMAELSARAWAKAEATWIKQHPLEAQIALHLGFWVLPNAGMAMARYVKRVMENRKKNDEQRNRDRMRSQENGEDTLDAEGTAASRASSLH